MKEIVVSETQASDVRTLVSFIRSRDGTSSAEIELLRKKRLPNYLEDTEEQIASKLDSLRQRQNPLGFLAGASGEVSEFLRHRDDDLAFHIETLRKCFVAYFSDGEIPPPHYPLRIAVILRKAGLHSLEQSFLEAWVSHVPGVGGGKYAALRERLEKMPPASEIPSGSST